MTAPHEEPVEQVSSDVLAAVRTLLPGLRVANYQERWAAGSPAVRALTILADAAGEPQVLAGDLEDPHVPTWYPRRPAGEPSHPALDRAVELAAAGRRGRGHADGCTCSDCELATLLVSLWHGEDAPRAVGCHPNCHAHGKSPCEGVGCDGLTDDERAARHG